METRTIVVLAVLFLAALTDARVQRCQTPIDLAIVLDSSALIGKANWENMKAFAKALVDSFDIAEKKTHVSIMTISTHPKIEIKFNTEPNDVTIKRDIDALKFRGGRSYINTALKMVASRMFTEQAGMRANVPKVCVVVTDGIVSHQDSTPGGVMRTSQMVKDKGVEIFALGVGGDMDVMNLIMTASTSDNVYGLSGWRTALRRYIKKRCSGPSLYA